MMIGAVATHLKRKDPTAELVPASVLGLLAAFVAYGRCPYRG